MADKTIMTETYLGQGRYADANNHSIYSPAANTIVVVTTIVVCETSGNADSYRIFHDNDGSTYDQSTALYYDKAINANDTHIIHPKIIMDDSSGNLAVRNATADRLTFTVYGYVMSEPS